MRQHVMTYHDIMSNRLALDVDPDTGAPRGCGDVEVSGAGAEHIRSPL